MLVCGKAGTQVGNIIPAKGQAAEILGISPRSMQRWKQRYEEHGYHGLFDRRQKRPSPKRVPMATVEKGCGCTGIHRIFPLAARKITSWIFIARSSARAG
jgi:hypothetical protein